MNQLKNTVAKHALNEDDLLARVRLANAQAERELFMKRNKWISVGVAAALLVTILFSWGSIQPILTGTSPDATITQDAAALAAPENMAYAMVSVDINPSFEIYTDEDGLVLKIKAMNDDAESLEIQTKAWIGEKVEDAVQAIIAQATEAGFIQSGDQDDDFALVTTVMLKEKDQETERDQEALQEKIKTRLNEDGALAEKTKVALIKAELVEKFEAEGKKIPLGLFVIQGMINKDQNYENDTGAEGEWVKVSDFIKNSENLDKLAKRATIVNAKQEREANRENGQSDKVRKNPATANQSDDVDDQDSSDDDDETNEAPTERPAPPASAAPGQNKNQNSSAS